MALSNIMGCVLQRAHVSMPLREIKPRQRTVEVADRVEVNIRGDDVIGVSVAMIWCGEFVF